MCCRPGLPRFVVALALSDVSARAGANPRKPNADCVQLAAYGSAAPGDVRIIPIENDARPNELLPVSEVASFLSVRKIPKDDDVGSLGDDICTLGAASSSCPSSFSGSTVINGTWQVSLLAGPNSMLETFLAEPAAASEGLRISGSCDVWWRYASEDVIPPIPELLIPVGTDEGSAVGLCLVRTAGSGAFRLGKVFIEGSKFARCYWDEGQFLDGGSFYVLQGRKDKTVEKAMGADAAGSAGGECSDADTAFSNSVFAQVNYRINGFLYPEDQEQIARIAGIESFSRLHRELNKLTWCEVREVFSASRFVPHRLNAQGLHAFRALLAERMYEARLLAVGAEDHPDFATWRSAGIILKDYDTLGEAGLQRLLSMAAAEEYDPGGDKDSPVPQPPYEWHLRKVSFQAGIRDPQQDLHVDSSITPIIKVWLMQSPPGVSKAQGPILYVPGSQRNTEGKLRWLHSYARPPSVEAMKEPSFRLLGSEAAAEENSGFVKWCNISEMPVLLHPNLQEPGHEAGKPRRVVVVADTSGLHHRGDGLPGEVRHIWRLRGDNDGGVKRMDPFRLPSARGHLRLQGLQLSGLQGDRKRYGSVLGSLGRSKPGGPSGRHTFCQPPCQPGERGCSDSRKALGLALRSHDHSSRTTIATTIQGRLFSRHWGRREARVVCRHLGLDLAVPSVKGSGPRGQAVDFEAKAPVLVSDIECQGHERDMNECALMFGDCVSGEGNAGDDVYSVFAECERHTAS